MRFKEFKKTTESVKKVSSQGTRYNSEIGMLAAFCDVDLTKFDPNAPENSFNAGALANPEKTFADIRRFLAPVYDQAKFSKFFDVGTRYKDAILLELQSLNEPAPTKFEWSGGSNINEEGAADIIFAGHPTVHGVSIKDESGITLSNLTPKALGLENAEVNDPDVFARFAGAEWLAMKTHAVNATLKAAQQNPGQPFVPVKSKYQIVYQPGPLAVEPQPVKKAAAKKPAPVPPGIANQQATMAVNKQPMGQEPVPQQEISEQAEQGYFEIYFDSPKTYKATASTILANIKKNANWQRVFGDYVQANWSKDTELRSLGDALFTKISEIFLTKIRSALENSNVLHRILRMGKLGYFYATPKKLYFVPGVEQVDELKVKDVVYGAPDGTAQKFLATIGYNGGKSDATILVYVRYANGMFDENPTVRGQDLKNPEGLSWVKLI